MKTILIFLFCNLVCFGNVSAEETTVYANANDGYVVYEGIAVWATCHDATSGNSTDSTVTFGNSSTDISYGAWAFTSFNISRGFLSFEKPEINGTITSIDLMVYPYNGDYDYNFTICAQKGTQGDTLEVGDFDAFSGSSYGTTVHTYNNGAYETISLNATAISDYNAQADTFYVCIREYTHDYNNSANTNFDSFGGIYYSEYAGTTYDPKIVITYTPTPTSTISGIISKYSSTDSPTGSKDVGAYEYILCDLSSDPHAVYASGTANESGEWSEDTADTDDEYGLVMYDNIDGMVYSGDWATATTGVDGTFTLYSEDWATGDDIAVAIFDPTETKAAVHDMYEANSSHQISDTYQHDGVVESGGLVFGFGFGTTGNNGLGYIKVPFEFGSGN